MTYDFGPFEFDSETGELFRAGRRLPLRPQVTQLLAVLLEQAGRLVSHRVLRDRLWNESTYVDWERGLYTCMRELRAALGDDAEAPRYVETLPGRGYRFVAPVTTRTGNGAGRGGARIGPEAGGDPAPTSNRPDDSPSFSAGNGSLSVESGARSGWLRLTLFLLVAGVTATVSWRFQQSPREATGDPGTGRVLIGQFENRTGDPMLDGSLDAAFSIGLERSLRSRSVPAQEISTALERMVRDARTPVDRAVGSELCLRLGAEFLVLGGVSRVDSTYQLDGQVFDPDTGKTLHAETRQALRDELLPALASISHGIVEYLHGRSLGGSTAGLVRKTPPLPTVTTTSFEALRSYSLALKERLAGDPESEAALLERAISLDPAFVMARLRLGVTYYNRGEYDAARGQFQAAQRRSMELTEFEQLYLTGWLANVEENAQSSLRAWTQMTRLFPEDPTGWYNRGMALYVWRYDFAGARESFEEAAQRARSPYDRTIASTAKAIALLATGDHKGALREFEARVSMEHPLAFAPIPALALQLEGDPEAAEHYLDRWTRAHLEARQDQAASYRAQFLASEGRWAEAAEVASRTLPEAMTGPETLDAVARRIERLVYLAAEPGGEPSMDRLEALAEQAESFPELEGLDATEGRVPILALFGTLSARSGRLDIAERAEDLARSLASTSGREGRFAAWLDLLRAEILSRRVGPEPAIGILESRITRTRFYPYHARARLAELYEASDRHSLAATEYDWLRRHRGRALVECPSPTALCEPDGAFNAVALGKVHRWMRRRSDGQSSARP